MAIAYADSIITSRLEAIRTACDAGATGALINIYSGSRPSKGGTATTLLAQLTMSTTAFGAVSGGSITANSITQDSSANATGTATWFRVTDSDGTFVLDGSVGTSGADLNLNSTSITATTTTVSVTSFVINAGNNS